MKDPEALSCNGVPRVGGQSSHKAALIVSSIVYDSRDGPMQEENNYGWAPPWFYPTSTWHHNTWPILTGSPLPISAHCKPSVKDWRQDGLGTTLDNTSNGTTSWTTLHYRVSTPQLWAQVYLTMTNIQVSGWILDQTFHFQLDNKYLLKYTTFFEVQLGHFIAVFPPVL